MPNATAILLNDTFELPLKRANRHGLVAGATGTGKTVTLHRMAEEFALSGVPVFAVDIKGDLSGIARAQENKSAVPVIFWDVLGKSGHPLRTTITEMGPSILGRLFDLNDVQQAILDVVFRVADENGWALVDVKDLRAMLDYIADHAKELSNQYGLISPASVAAIQRALLQLENDGGLAFFAEPAIAVKDLIHTDVRGQGMVNILAADQLHQRPRLYAAFMLWLLAELYEDLPEIGDPAKPKLVLFLDEAHLLFNDTPKALLEKIEQVVRLIRSKGVGVYFITQSPTDIPETILAQLGNRVQHALRAFTPKDQKAVRVAAETFRANPNLDTAKTITEMGVGEALVSVLGADGAPTPVERIKIALPANSQLGAIVPGARAEILRDSPFAGQYDTVVDGDSAYERLQYLLAQEQHNQAANAKTARATSQPAGRPRDNLAEATMKSAARAVGSSIGRQIGRQIIRGILGAVLR
jgi:DNA helicase HerA-like ATPase